MTKLSAKHMNWLNFGAFDGTVLFVCGFTYGEIMNRFKNKKTSEGWVTAFENTKNMWDDDTNHAFCSKEEVSGKTYFIMVLKNRFDFRDGSHATLAHEILHLISQNLPEFLDPMRENECFAYTHTFLMNQCYAILRK